MRNKAIALAAVAVLALGVAGLSAQSAEDAKFTKYLDTFWDAYFKFFPTEGTVQGFMKYNDKLEDFRMGTIEKFLESLDKFNQELVTKLNKTTMSPDIQIEFDIHRDFLDQEIMKLENSLFRIDNPLFYNQVFLNSLRSLFQKTSLPADARIKSAAERAKAVPSLVKSAKDNLKTPPPEYTEAAIRQIGPIIDYYRTEVPRLAGSAPALQSELDKAVTALSDYQRFLQNELRGRSTGNFRLGEFHLRMLRMQSAGSLPIIEEIAPRANADYNNIRNAMGGICLSYFKVMFPTIDTDLLATQKGVEPALQFVMQSVLDKLKANHPAADGYLKTIQDKAGTIRSYLSQNGLVDLPADDLGIEAMPPWFGGFSKFRLEGPGALEATGPFTLYVRPIPANLDPETLNSLLEEYTDYTLNYLVAQQVYPGMFVPTFLSRQRATPVQRMHPNKALNQGWPLYLGEMMIYSGFNNFNLRERLNQLKAQLKAVILFQMDINIHEGGYDKQKVVDYMMRGGFMTRAEAEMLFEDIILNPGEAALTYIGYQELLDMEKAYRNSQGEAFTKKDFLQKVLSYGSIPLRNLKMKIVQ